MFINVLIMKMEAQSAINKCATMQCLRHSTSSGKELESELNLITRGNWSRLTIFLIVQHFNILISVEHQRSKDQVGLQDEIRYEAL